MLIGILTTINIYSQNEIESIFLAIPNRECEPVFNKKIKTFLLKNTNLYTYSTNNKNNIVLSDKDIPMNISFAKVAHYTINIANENNGYMNLLYESYHQDHQVNFDISYWCENEETKLVGITYNVYGPKNTSGIYLYQFKKNKLKKIKHRKYLPDITHEAIIKNLPSSLSRSQREKATYLLNHYSGYKYSISSKDKSIIAKVYLRKYETSDFEDIQFLLENKNYLNQEFIYKWNGTSFELN